MKMIKKIMGDGMTFVMLNCDKATFLLSKKEVSPLSFFDSIRLKIHLLSCSYCRRFAQQSALLTKQINSICVIDPNNLKIKLTDDQKVCLQHKLDDQMNN